ncbi:MAG TPA: tRNA (cytidine(34)-2'-O)-methyltransferase [Phenylobacterium sp.]|jgi:tRNA (cytidine/uridine-2'-O-)-methyltransferase
MRLALFQPDIPQNLGAAIRLGACLGVPVDVIEPCGFPVSDRALKRAALDYARIADISRHPGWSFFRTECERENRRIVLFTTKGATPLISFRFQADDVLLLGRESAGVPDEVHQAAGARVVIPLVAGARSLNVVTAAAIGLGEALRQINAFPSPAGRG